MLVNDAAAAARLNSPLNLMNRMKAASSSPRQNAMNLFGMNRSKREEVKEEIKEKKEEKEEEPKKLQVVNPFAKIPPPEIPIPDAIQITELVENSEAQVKLALAHNQALDLLNCSVKALAAKLGDVKADKLPGVITAASKVVDNIRRERNEAAKLGKDKEVHYHFYTPQQRKLSEYEIIDVEGTATPTA